MTTNQIEKFGQKVYVWQRTTQQTFLKNFSQNICNETAIKNNFHFYRYKCMEILSCYNNQTTKYLGNGNKKQ